MSIIDKIISILDEKCLSQKDLTDYLGIDKSTFSQWKAGKSQSFSRYLQQIADFLEVSIDYLTSDTIKVDFLPHELEEENIIKCPVCGYDYTHFKRIISVSYKSEKSSGVALEYFCEAGHPFFLLTETYKGNSYLVFTDNSCIIKSAKNVKYESAPIPLSEHKEPFNNKKYRTLDKYGKKAVDSVLDIEYERCSLEQEDKSNVIELPFAMLKASAGLGDYLFDENFEMIEVEDSETARKASFVIQIDGDSMLPRFKNGDKVFVKGQQEIELGEIGIFIVDGQGFIKQMGEKELISINPEFPNIPINEYNEFKCVGKIIGIV
ncbi:MAG: LexA family transcriptional regulator [Ruminococcus sp.]|nr:LexA family transcriptional regulator [Ruminococcus sp.]